MHERSRRAVLGTAGVALTAALAGCNGQPDPGSSDGGGGGQPGESGTPPGGYAAVERWLEGDSDDAAASNYDGTFTDLRGKDTVTIEVGAQGNGGSRAFAPVAAVISAGTTVRWSWTGQGGNHDVVAAPDEQLGESDYEFASGEPESGSDVTFSQTFPDSGYVLYQCRTHRSDGMKGGLGVE